MKKLSIYLTVMIMAVGVLGTTICPAMANTGENMFSDAIFTSKDTLKNTFYVDHEDSVSLIEEDGTKMISVKRDGSSFESNRLISKKKVEAKNFVYTVEAAATKISGSQYTEIPIIVGVQDGYGSYTQVYINKSVDDSVTVNVAFLEKGVFRKVLSDTCYVEDAAKDDTFFTVRLEVNDYEMDIYVNDAYVSTIDAAEEDFTGYVGVRCTGSIKIKSMSLVEEEADPTEEPTPETTEDPNAPPVFPTDDNNATRPSLAPIQTTSPDQEGGLSGTAIGGIVIGVVAVVCVAAIVIFTMKQGKKK